MEIRQLIADSNTDFADTPKRDFHELSKYLSDEYQQCDDFGTPSKRARTLGSDNGSHHEEPFSDELDQRDKSIAANRGMLDSPSYNMGINYEGFPEYPMSGWGFEDNFDGGLTGVTSEIVDLTLPDAEGFDGVSLCSIQPSDKDGVFTSTHNSPDTPLSAPDGEMSQSKPTSDNKSSETIQDTCFGYASSTHHSCLIITHINDR